MPEIPSRCPITSCQVPIRVRYCEVDRMNAVHHSRYAVYFEIGRTELLRKNGYDYKTLEDKGILLVIARLEVRFKAAARYDDELVLTTRLSRMNRVKLEHEYELVRPADRQVIATGKTVLVHVDRQGRLRALPELLSPQ